MCPISGTYKITLSTSLDKTGVIETFTNADAELADNAQQQWKSVIVEQGIWILYNGKNYNDDNPDSGKFQRVFPGQTVLVDFQPKSLRPLTATANSITLFEHKNYGGKMRVYTTNQPYLPDFPPSTVTKTGVSSVYITDSRKWDLFLGPNYSLGSFRMDPKQENFYPDLKTYNAQDEAVQSIKYV